MKKILSFILLGLMCSIGNLWAAETIYDFETGALADNFAVTSSDAGATNSIEVISTYEYSSGKHFAQYPSGSTKLFVTSFGSTKGTSTELISNDSFTNISEISFYIASTDRGKTQLEVAISPYANFSSEVTTVQTLATLSDTQFGGTSNGNMKKLTYTGLAASGYIRIKLAQFSTSNNKIMALDNIVITTAAADYVAQPVISQSGNTISLSSATIGAAIHYTLDGSDPDENSTLYSTPFNITEDKLVKAIASKGGNNSEISSLYCGFDKVFSETSFIRFDDGNFTDPHGLRIEGITFGNGISPVESSMSLDGYDFTSAIQFDGGSFNTNRYFSLKVESACKIYVYGHSNNNDDVRYFLVKEGTYPSDQNDGVVMGDNAGGYMDASLYEYTSVGGTTIYFTPTNGKNYRFYAIKIVFGNENAYTATIGSTGYATLALPYAVSIPTGVTAYTGSLNGAGDAVSLTQITNGIIPANTGVVISGEAGNYTFNETTSAGNAVSSLGSTAGNGLDISGETDSYYVLAKEGDDAVFARVANTTYKVIPANKAYVSVPAGSAPSLRIIEANNGATNIMNVDDVENAIKFIENGKLYIKKNGVTYNAVGAVVK